MLNEIQVAFTCWHIWKSRCIVVLGRKELNVHATIYRIKAAVSELLSVQAKVTNTERDRGRGGTWE